MTGEVWPQAAIDYAPETGEEDEDTADDPEQWLAVPGEGSRQGYRDMELFIASVEDPGRAERLAIAITGRGAFRRFKAHSLGSCPQGQSRTTRETSSLAFVGSKQKLSTRVGRASGYPSCVAGRSACPPEDCGGVWGYAHLREALADPTHEEHEELMDWLGLERPSEFDPAAFDLDEANEVLASISAIR